MKYNPYEESLAPVHHVGTYTSEGFVPAPNSSRQAAQAAKNRISTAGTVRTITDEEIEEAVQWARQKHAAEAVVASVNGVNRSDDSGKTNYTLVDYDMLDRWAVHMTGKVGVRGKNNWRNAGPEDAERFMEGAWRHFMSWVRGEQDEDHAAALFFNVAGYEYARD